MARMGLEKASVGDDGADLSGAMIIIVNYKEHIA